MIYITVQRVVIEKLEKSQICERKIKIYQGMLSRVLILQIFRAHTGSPLESDYLFQSRIRLDRI